MPIPGSAILNDPTKRTTFTVEFYAATQLRGTAYPTNLVIGGQTYFAANGFEVGAVKESRDGSSIIECTLRVLNLGNSATAFVTDASYLKRRVVIQRVWFDASWAIDTVETWFDGFIARSTFEGDYVVIHCRVDFGRQGRTPLKDYATLMTSHTPPAPDAKLLT